MSVYDVYSYDPDTRDVALLGQTDDPLNVTYPKPYIVVKANTKVNMHRVSTPNFIGLYGDQTQELGEKKKKKKKKRQKRGAKA